MNGYYEEIIRIKADAEPIDNISKFAWADDDYETVEIWHEYTTAELEEQRQNKIEELKQKINSTNDIVMDILAGIATKEEYADVLDQRKLWRMQINELENTL